MFMKLATNSLLIEVGGAAKMSQWVKALADNSEDQSLIPRTPHDREKEPTPGTKLSSALHTCMYLSTHTSPLQQIIVKLFFFYKLER